MEVKSLIDFENPLVKFILPTLLQDYTTERNIIWVTNPPENLEGMYTADDEITIDKVYEVGIKPRCLKRIEDQKKRTKGKAEVFTPTWLCNKMNNNVDNNWFKKENVFNKEVDKSWETNKRKIRFTKKSGTWEDYVKSTRLEVTCGEAPFLVSRYDTTSGEIIPIENRVGLLDRKLRVINENAKTEGEWFYFVMVAFQSIYGFEFQGDNLLLARTNLFLTFVEYYQNRFGKDPNLTICQNITNVIYKNIWQMDGLKYCIPNHPEIQCKIYDWDNQEWLYFTDMIKK